MNSLSKKQFSLGKIVRLAIKIYLAIFILVILIWGVNLAWHMFDLYRLSRSLQSDTEVITSERLIPWLEAASGDVGTIHDQLNPLFPAFNALRIIPWIGPYLGQVEPLLSFANGLSLAGREIVYGSSPLLDQPSSDLSNLSFPERLTQVLQGGQAHFIAAAPYIQQASQARERIHADLLPSSVRPLYQRLDSQFNLLEAGVQLLQSVPGLMGSTEPQTYLVLAQNRDELRATGGFISGIGLVTLQNGKITQFSLGDSYAVDDFSKPYPAPPEPLHRFMLTDYWLARDANWSPDFPTAARQTQELYTLSTGIETQGVIAFNQLLVKGVLQVIGPVQVPGTDEPVTADNVEKYMRQAWAPAPEQGLSDEWWQHRKDFMQLLGNVIIAKVITLQDTGQLLNLANTIRTLLDQGQLLLYFNDQTIEQAFKTAGWDGALHPGESDYVYLVDSNIGFNKVDSLIQRSVSYEVDLRDISHPMGKIDISYHHTGIGDVPCRHIASYGNGTYQDMQQRCYWDYWRLYTPANVDLKESTVQPVPAGELLNGLGWLGQVEKYAGEAGSQSFAGLLVIPQSQTSQTELVYSLPLTIIGLKGQSDPVYSLTVQIQPGLNGLPFRLEIIPPNHTTVSNPGAGWSHGDGNTWIWRGTLSQSSKFTMYFEPEP